MTSREEMIEVIQKRYGLNSPDVLDAIRSVPRERFVSPEYRYLTYEDRPIPIGYDQMMSQPYTVAYMTHLLLRTKNIEQRTKGRYGRVLEIGTGSGYQAAVLSYLFKEVYTVEIIKDLAKQAKKTLKELGYENVYVKVGSGEWGWEGKAPFDAIMITAAVESEIPKALVNQLKIGGVIVAPIGPRWLQTMTRFTKVKKSKDKFKSQLMKEEFDKYVFVPFIHKQK